MVERLQEAECGEAEVKNRLSLCEEKKIASVSDFSLPQWIVPFCWLGSKTGLFVSQSAEGSAAVCGHHVYVWSGLVTDF